MPSGWIHDTINLLVLLAITAHLFNTRNPQAATLFAAGYLAGVYLLSPDLDTRSRSYRRWGPLRYIWLPYILIFKHRGLSHNPVIGPLTRLLYLGALIIGITSLLNIALPTPSIPPLNTALFLLLGYWTPSVVHWLVDKKI